MADAKADVLREAIARNSAAVLSLPSAGILRHYKSRFVAEAEHEGKPAFWVESDKNEHLLVTELINTKKPSAVSFKSGTNKVVFLSPIMVQDLSHQLNATTNVSAVLMAWPTSIKSVQRRSNYRVRLTADGAITVRIWRIGEQVYLGDRPSATTELPLSPRDLSIGGLGVTFLPKGDEPPKISSADRLRIQITIDGQPFLIEGRMKHPDKAPKTATPLRAGIEFRNLGSDLEGRQKLALLTRVVGDVQRDEVRRYRLGVA